MRGSAQIFFISYEGDECMNAICDSCFWLVGIC